MASIQKRTSAEGKTTFRVQIRLKGFPSQTATFDRLTDARQWIQQTETAIKEGRYFKKSEARKRTLGEAIDRYFKDVLSHKKNPVNQTLYLNWWKDALGDYMLSDITAARIVEKRGELMGSVNQYGRKVGATTANRYTQGLSHLFSVAMKEWEWVDSNPVLNIRKHKESRGRVRFLSDDERAALLAACKDSTNPYLYPVVVLALSTGARKMEILPLQWKDIDLERRSIVLHETKNGERRVLPLQGHAYQLIQSLHAQRQLNCAFVFPSDKVTRDDKTGAYSYQPIDIRRAWEYAIKGAGIEDFRFHDLRHSAASYLAMNGASLAEIAEVLGHKTLQMVKRYAHLSEAHTSSVVASMNERIFGDA
jgi:integrase